MKNRPVPAEGPTIAIIGAVPEADQSAVELLKSVQLFADLEEGELERFSHVAVPRSFPAGTRVFHEESELRRVDVRGRSEDPQAAHEW